MTQTLPTSDNVVPLPRTLRENPQAAVTDFVRDHPLLVLAGGVVAGALISSLLPKGAARKIAGRAVGLAEIAGAATAALGRDAWDKAETAGSAIGKRGGSLASDLADLAGDFAGKAGDIAGKAGNLGRAGATRASDATEAAAERIEKIATPATQAAAEFAELVAEKASEIASRFRRR